MKLTAGEAADAMRGELVAGSPDSAIEGVSIDSRTLAPGAWFFAIRGPRYDGHAFVESALGRGARGVVVSEPVDVASPLVCIRVEDTSVALQELAREVRERAAVLVVAVTGSMGKTTTKEATATAIGSSYRVLKSEGNLNNLYGLPLSLLRLDGEEVAVVEMGMSAPGEIARLVEIAKPDVGVLTNVGEVNLEFFPSVRAIADAKGELLVGLAERAVAVVNADDPLVLEQARKFSGRTIRFGLGPGAELRAREIRPSSDGVRFLAEEGERSVEVRSPLRGRHNVYNVLAGLAAARALDVPLERAVTGLRNLAPASHRGERLRLADGVLAIDETYNSSPDALRCALDALEDESAGRRIAVVGDMLELGPMAETRHREIGEEMARRDIALLVGVGSLGSLIVDAAREAGMDDSRLATCADVGSAGPLLVEHVREGDTILFKASRGVQLEKAIESLKRALGEEP